jgi:hypothetical protein
MPWRRGKSLTITRNQILILLFSILYLRIMFRFSICYMNYTISHIQCLYITLYRSNSMPFHLLRHTFSSLSLGHTTYIYVFQSNCYYTIITHEDMHTHTHTHTLSISLQFVCRLTIFNNWIWSLQILKICVWDHKLYPQPS